MFDDVNDQIKESFAQAKEEIAKKLRDAGDDKLEWLLIGFKLGTLVIEAAQEKKLPMRLAYVISHKMAKDAGTIVAAELEAKKPNTDTGYYGPG